MDLSVELENKGFAIAPGILALRDVGAYREDVDAALKNGDSRERAPGVRNVFDVTKSAREFAVSAQLRQMIEPILGANYFAVRALIFDKNNSDKSGANWKVPYHQDLSIAVQAQSETRGFSAWSVKAGVLHVQPPIGLLEKMLTVRLHLDDCDESNGALRVLVGSHRFGKLSATKIQDLRQSQQEEICAVPASGVLLMRPMILHASSPAKVPRRRRVLHLEFACEELPSGLQWHWRVPEYS